MNFGKFFGKKSKDKSSKSSNEHLPKERDVRSEGTNVRERAAAPREKLHSETILNVRVVDSSSVVTGSQDRTIAIYDFDQRRIRRRWTGHEHDVVKVLYGRSLNLIVSSSRDRSIRFWNFQSDSSVLQLNGHDLVVTAIDLNPDNSFLVSGSRDNKVNFWDTKTGKLLKTILIGRNLITDAKWSHDGTFIAQTGEDKETKMYDARTMTQVVSFPKKQYIQTSCDISNDDRFLMSTSNGFNNSGAEISLWDIRQRKLLTEFYGHRATVNSGYFVDSTASTIVSCSNDGRAILWNVQQNSILCELDVDRATPLTSIVPINSQSFATSELDGKLNFLQRSNQQFFVTDQI